MGSGAVTHPQILRIYRHNRVIFVPNLFVPPKFSVTLLENNFRSRCLRQFWISISFFPTRNTPGRKIRDQPYPLSRSLAGGRTSPNGLRCCRAHQQQQSSWFPGIPILLVAEHRIRVSRLWVTRCRDEGTRHAWRLRCVT